jgi:glycosyltransferase involved in cell wall biosynthesis
MFRAFKRLSKAVLILRELDRIRTELELLKSRVDTPAGIFDALERERESIEYETRHSKAKPLVSVCINTYNRADLLCERALKSICQQSYANLEIVVIGDGCTDDTERRVGRIRDSRIRFENRSTRGTYPQDPTRRWCVAGTAAFNHALEVASGDYITHLDDDDEHLPHRVELLLEHMRSKRLEVAFHPFWFESTSHEWNTNAAENFTLGSVTTSSVMYDSFLKCIPADPQAHLLGEPGDWNRLRKFKYLGARIGRHSAALLRHYRERNQPALPAQRPTIVNANAPNIAR